MAMMCSALLAAPAYQSADRCLSGRPETGVYPLTIGSKLQIAKAVRLVEDSRRSKPMRRSPGQGAPTESRLLTKFDTELRDARDPRQPSHPAFNLSAMIKAYDAEGAQTLIRGFARWHRSGGPVPTQSGDQVQ